jgi:hypothetical protein
MRLSDARPGDYLPDTIETSRLQNHFSTVAFNPTG